MSDLESLKDQVEVIKGAQHALTYAVNMALMPYRGNAQAAEALAGALESAKASLLASNSSDRSIQAFEEIADTLVQSLK